MLPLVFMWKQEVISLDVVLLDLAPWRRHTRLLSAGFLPLLDGMPCCAQNGEQWNAAAVSADIHPSLGGRWLKGPQTKGCFIPPGPAVTKLCSPYLSLPSSRFLPFILALFIPRLMP